MSTDWGEELIVTPGRTNWALLLSNCLPELYNMKEKYYFFFLNGTGFPQ